MSAREEVLSRVRRAAAGAVAPIVPREYRRADGTAADLELLVERLRDYKAEVHATVEADLPQVMAGLLQGPTLVPVGFPGDWLLDVERVADDSLTPLALDQVGSVVTTCTVAIAETGTLVLDGSPGQGRRAVTLVPDRHVAVVRASQVVLTVPQALARLEPTRPQTWISGPSATSDIELQRVEGVHGPRTLVVVLVS